MKQIIVILLSKMLTKLNDVLNSQPERCLTSRDRPKSAPNLKNRKRTSKCQSIGELGTFYEKKLSLTIPKKTERGDVYNVEHLLQDSDIVFAKNACFCKKFFQKNVMCYFDQNFKNHQTATVAVYNAQTVPESQQKGPNC